MERSMKSLIVKRSIKIAGRHTSVSVEDAFWNALREIAYKREQNLSELIYSINADRNHANLSSAIRVFVVGYYREQCLPRFKSAA